MTEPVDVLDELAQMPAQVEPRTFSSTVVDDALASMVEWVESQPDTTTRCQAAHYLKETVIFQQFYKVTLTELRAAYIRAMATEGWSDREIGEALGVTRARVNQIALRGFDPR